MSVIERRKNQATEPANLTDSDLMPFGSHRGRKLKSINTGYLIWLHAQRVIKQHPGLSLYIERRCPSVEMCPKKARFA